jgi:hypothetical protein
MSKIALTPNASGSGTLTIAAPNTNTDSTINLPDASGSFVTANTSGNVGIGTSSPTSFGDGNTKLAVVSNTSGTADVNIRWGTNAVKGILYCNDVSGAGIGIGSTTSAYLGFLSNGTERMRIDSSGNVLMATTTLYPGDGNTATGFMYQASAGKLFSSCSGGNTTFNFNLNGTGVLGYFCSSGTRVGNISVTGSSTSYNTSSDYRLKENVVEVTDGISRVKLLKPSRFNFIADPDKTVDGFLAHEVANVVPEAITGTKDEVDDDGNPEYQGIDQSKLVPLLTAALQEAITKIESLEARVATLESA